MRIEDKLIVLSERNLRALLIKLSEPNSCRTIIAPDGTAVHAEHDAVHYANRVPPSPMSKQTEASLKKAELTYRGHGGKE